MNKKVEIKKSLSPIDLEEQEHLSKDIINYLTPQINIYHKQTEMLPRPTANFIDLMNWVVDEFGGVLKGNINKFVHNRIIIDGQFVQFCKEQNVTITPLYRDSIVSWKTEHNFEKFFVQGVFLIKSKDFEFIHSALFHKGNQNEDEISFFILVSNDMYDKYISFRNKFDSWILARDRSNLRVRVIDGEDIPYTTDQSWDDLFLPEDIKHDLKSLVEGFLSSKDFYIKNKIPWKRGVFLYGSAGCGKTSIIRTVMSMYNFKPVTVLPDSNSDSVRDAFAYAQEQSPSLLYFEDLDSMLERGLDTSSFLNLMDGISTQNGMLIIATANNISKLKENITSRPSRFDRKFEIPIPDQKMAYIYLKKWFGNMVTPSKCKELSKYSEKHGFSYAYLKELYISSMFEALSNNRQIANIKDIDNALKCLIKDKNILNTKNISTSKYFNENES